MEVCTVYAQCQDLEINISKNIVCIGEPFDVEASQTALEYFWDFCPGDILFESANTSLIATLPQSQRSLGLAIAKSEEGWYGMATSRDNNSIIRFYFGDGLQSPPTSVENLGNINLLLNQPASIQLLYRNSSWYALVHNWANRNLILLDFGESLSGEPTGQEWVDNIGSSNSFLKVASTPDSVIAVVTNTNAKLSIVHIPADLSTKPTTGDRFETSTLSGFSTFMDIEIVYICGEWYGFAASLNNRKLFRIHFGNSIYSDPDLVQEIGSSLFGSNNPASLQLVQENGNYILIVNTTSGQLYRAVLGSSILNSLSNANINQIGSSFGVGYDLAFGKSEGSWYGYVINDKNGDLFKVDFPQACESSISNSNYKESKSIFYTSSGKHFVNLEIIDDNGIISSITDSILVEESVAPEINFAYSSSCSASPAQFTLSTDQALTSAAWYIEGDILAGESINYSFPSPGTYPVTLEVETADGCGQRVTEEVTIYEPPEPSFTVDQEVICTNGEVTFQNLTDTKGADEVITYAWDFNGEGSSTEANPTFSFTTEGSKTVRLTASIPGCANTYDTTFVVEQGPVVDFSVPIQICQGEEVIFENLSTGENITGYRWSFGDGGTFNSSTSESPAYVYDSAGSYIAMLEVNNTVGCANTLSKTVSVYSQPEAAFTADIACAGAPTQFIDESTTGINSNVIAWNWNFGDGEGYSNARNPQYTYALPGVYEATLIVLTSAGCSDTLQQEIIVESAVQADFSAQTLCPTEAAPFTVQFTDISSVNEDEEITEWLWTINGENFVIAEPSFTFETPGTYQVSLTVFSASACNASVTKNITIDTPPTPAFSFEPNCASLPVNFVNESLSEAVEISQYRWDFGEEGISYEENPEFIFEEAGTYQVNLSLETTAGCQYSMSQEVNIPAAPQASFTADVTNGGAPLTVNFTNTSTAVDSLRWTFGEEANAHEASPSYTFTQPGSYIVTLDVFNALGCTDQYSQTIEVVEPVSDLQLQRMSLLSEEGSADVSLLLNMRNLGNLTASNFDIVITLDEILTITKTFEGSLAPGEAINYPLDFSVSAQLNQNIDLRYVCATISSLPDEEKIANNRTCLSLNSNFSVIAPYPNPSGDMFQLDMVLPQQETVYLSLISTTGKVLEKITYTDTKVGLNTFNIDVSSMITGNYILQVGYLEHSKTYRLMVGP